MINPETSKLAIEIASDFGADIESATSAILRNDRDAEARFFGLGLSEAMSVGSFIVACVGVALEVWKFRQDRDLLMLAIAAGLDRSADSDLESDPRLASLKLSDEQKRQLINRIADPEKRLGIVARIVDKIAPRSYRSPLFLPSKLTAGASEINSEIRSRAEWAKEEWSVTNPPAASGSPADGIRLASLIPFADMDFWAVHSGDIVWERPSDAPGLLPKKVTVPQGFVTDFASVPEVFWWAVAPTGRHGHAAIIHDWLYWQQSVEVNRAISDRVFDVAMGQSGVDLLVRKVMWAAVRIYGGSYWTANRAAKIAGELRVLQEFPVVPVSWADWRVRPGVFRDPT
jgi:hypothetical protein